LEIREKVYPLKCRGVNLSLLNLEHLVQPGQFEQFFNQSLEFSDDYPAAVMQSFFMDGDKGSQPGTVDIVDTFEIDDKISLDYAVNSENVIDEVKQQQ
jgi:hypothetical protein